MRIAIRKFFNEMLDVDFELANEHIADMVDLHFPRQRERLTTLLSRLSTLQSRPELPPSLANLQSTFEKCMRPRLVESTVLAVHANLDALRDGLRELGEFLGDLTESALQALKTAQRVHSTESEQLRQVGAGEAVAEAGSRLEQQLSSPRPWEGIGQVAAHVRRLQEAYREARSDLLNRHELKAESLREKVKSREGFARLSAEQGIQVLRPIREALVDTTPEAVSPTLSYLRDSVPSRLDEAATEANRRLDAILAELDQVKVVPFRPDLSGRELQSEQDVDNLLEELRGKLLAQLKKDVRIRLV
jgi:hypothetical protein